jgi:hypothetical protein
LIGRFWRIGGVVGSEGDEREMGRKEGVEIDGAGVYA